MASPDRQQSRPSWRTQAAGNALADGASLPVSGAVLVKLSRRDSDREVSFKLRSLDACPAGATVDLYVASGRLVPLMDADYLQRFASHLGGIVVHSDAETTRRWVQALRSKAVLSW